MNDDMSGTGHGSLAVSPDGQEMFYVYHGRKGTTGGRKLFQDRLTIDETKIDEDTGLPTVSVLQTVTDQAVPSGVAPYTIVSDTESLELSKADTYDISWKVTSATGAALPITSSLDRVVAEIEDTDIASIVSTDGKSSIISGNRAGQTVLTLKYQRKSADGTFYDVTNTVDGITSKAERKIIINVSEEHYVNEVMTYTLHTSNDIKSLKVYNENGGTIKINSLKKVQEGDKLAWTVSFAVSTPGEREFTIKGIKVGGAMVDVTKITPTIIQPAPEIKSVSAPESVLVYESFNVDIVTSTSVKTIRIANEKGNNMGKKLISKTVDGMSVIWTYAMEIGTAGSDRTFTISGIDAGGAIGTGSFSIDVTKSVK